MTSPTQKGGYRPPRSGPTYMSLIVRSQIAPWLKRIRRFREWSVRDAAKVANVTHSTFSRAERGHVTDAKTWVALSAFVQANWPRIIK